MTHYDIEDIIIAIKNSCPNEDIKAILSMLDKYGCSDSEPEKLRVQLAILKLSQGNTQKLIHFLERAKQDYRDLLFWAEYNADGSPLENPYTDLFRTI